MKLESIQAAEAKLLLPTYERNPILFVGGEGVYLIDENGERISICSAASASTRWAMDIPR